MGQTGKRNYTDAVPPSRFAKSERSVRRARYKKRKKALALIACILVLAFIAIFALEPASASTKTLLQSFRRAEEAQSAPVEEQVSEGIIHIQPAEDALTGGSADFALRDAGALSIVSWQGAKNCGESFDVTLNGVEEGQFVQFVANNCTVFPQTGSTDDVYTVTVTGAGSYSLTAMTDDTAAAHDTRNGVAGKADQLPLSVSGWGGAQDYYDSFRISVSGGNTGGAITFQTDGCTVSPETGNANTVFDVTVTRVGSYELTAIMDGDRNFNPAYSAKMSGCSSKSPAATKRSA
jgi:type II secretory pathway component PulM